MSSIMASFQSAPYSFASKQGWFRWSPPHRSLMAAFSASRLESRPSWPPGNRDGDEEGCGGPPEVLSPEMLMYGLVTPLHSPTTWPEMVAPPSDRRVKCPIQW